MLAVNELGFFTEHCSNSPKHAETCTAVYCQSAREFDAIRLETYPRSAPSQPRMSNSATWSAGGVFCARKRTREGSTGIRAEVFCSLFLPPYLSTALGGLRWLSGPLPNNNLLREGGDEIRICSCCTHRHLRQTRIARWRGDRMRRNRANKSFRPSAVKTAPGNRGREDGPVGRSIGGTLTMNLESIRVEPVTDKR